MRIAVAVPEPHVSAPILNAALEGVTRLNERLIDEGAVPTFRESVNHVRWKPEPPGGEHFDHAAIVNDRGWGDCDDLAPWHAASLRVTGEDPGARAVARRSGPKRWHCEVKRSDGTIEDPSREAGMPAPGGVVGTRAATLPVMFQRSSVVGGVYMPVPHLALRPIQDRHGRPESWQARTDLPWHWQPGKSAADVAMVSLHKSPITDQALVGACRGAIALGEASGFASDEDLDRLDAIIDACHGATWEDLADEYGPEHATAAGHVVGSFFGKAFKKLGRAITHPEKTLKWAAKTATMPARVALSQAAETLKAAKPLAAQALPLAQAAAPFANFIPGIGPLASMAFQAASPMLQQLLQSGQHMPPPGFQGGGGMPMGMGMPMGQSPWGMAPMGMGRGY
jgi:hypothetical protein